ncbi:hypothetical protein [Micromonospora sp. NPDC050200]|uniref:hypothetical protein n=1 Tax=Micromonospora sp. NPDC050200 TaxID=3155664 RepID=UPI0033D33462
MSGGMVGLRWEHNVEVTVSPDGWLILHRQQTATTYRYPPFVTVSWISLQRHGGDLHLAADEVATSWQADRAEIIVVIARWLDELRDAGLVRED